MKLHQAAECQRTDFRCVRDKAVSAALIFCGLRRQEFLDLTVEAVNLKEQSLLVAQGKGQKRHNIYLCDEALIALREWLAIRQQLTCRHTYLFVGEGSRHLGDQGLATLLAVVGHREDFR